ncbi:MAG TPA: hypothetical protein VF228_10190 [Iamia sp.]
MSEHDTPDHKDPVARYDDMADQDPVARYDELTDRVRMLAVPADQVVSRRIILSITAAMLALLVAILAGVVGITFDTNQDQEQIVKPLQDRNMELEEMVADLEDVNEQAVAEVIRLATLLQENGIDPGFIEIRPTDEGD